MAVNPPAWANEVVVDVLCSDSDWTLREGGGKKPYLDLWVSIPGQMQNWTYMQAWCTGERALSLADFLEEHAGQVRYTLRARVEGRRPKDGGGFWGSSLALKEIEIPGEVGIGEINPAEILDFSEQEESRLRELAVTKAQRIRRRQTAARFYVDAANWAFRNGFLDTLGSDDG